MTTPDPPRSSGPSQDLVEKFAALDAAASAIASPSASVERGMPEGRSSSARYTFEAVFASGGLGQIRRAYDHRLKRYVAAKELQHYRPGHPSEARFLREALLTARLEHPSIVPIHDLGAHATGETFYCMKLVDGRSLDDLVGASTNLLERLALVPHLLAVADAVAYAHENSIIHRDLKPSNVLVGAFGETLVIDWGLAKELSAETEPTDSAAASVSTATLANDLTRSGEFLGTLAFMPPEQAEGERLDPRADVYSLGAILYFVLSGRTPYERRSAVTTLADLLAGPPPDLSTRAAGLPADLLAIVRKAMARVPSDRYATAHALATDLRRFQAGRLISARPYSALDLLQHFLRQYRTAVVWAGASLALVLGVAAFSYVQILAQKQEADRQREEAVQQGNAARIAQTRAERLVRASAIAARDLYLESGRKKLFQEQNSQEALVLLNEAYKLDRDHDITRLLLAQATRSTDSLVYRTPYLAQERMSISYDDDGSRLLLSAPHGDTFVLDATTGERRADLELVGDTIVAAEFLNDAESTVVTYTGHGALARFAADNGELRAYDPIQGRSDLVSSDLEAMHYFGLAETKYALLGDASNIWAVDLLTGRVEHSFALAAGQHIQASLYDARSSSTVFSLWDLNRIRQGLPSALIAWSPTRTPPSTASNINLDLDLSNARHFVVGGGKIYAFEHAGDRRFISSNPHPTVWDLQTAERTTLSPCAEIDHFRAPNLALSPDGEDLFAVDSERIVRWNIRSRACEAMSEPLRKKHPLSSERLLHVHSKEHGILLQDSSSVIARFNYTDLSFQASFMPHESPLEQLALQPKGTLMTSVPLEGEIRVWNLDDARILSRASFDSGLAGKPPAAQRDYQRIRDALRAPCSLLTVGPTNVRPAMDAFSESALEMDRIQLVPEPARGGDSQILRLGDSCDIWDTDEWRRHTLLHSTSKGLLASPVASLINDRFLLLHWRRSGQTGDFFNALHRVPDLAPIEIYPPLLIVELTRDFRRGWGFGSVEEISPRRRILPLGQWHGYDFTVSPDARYLVNQSDSGTTQIYDAKTGILMEELGFSTNAPSRSSSSSLCTMPKFSPTWEIFLASRKDGTIDVWDAQTFIHIKSLRGHTRPICGSEFDPMGARAVTFDEDGIEAYLWALDDDSEGIEIDSPDTRIVRFSPRGDVFATGDRDGVIRLWHADGGQQVGEFRGHGDTIERLMFSEDGTRLYSLDAREEAIEWQIVRESRSPEQLAELIDEAVPYRLTGGRVVLK